MKALWFNPSGNPCEVCEYPWGNACGKACAYDARDHGQNLAKGQKRPGNRASSKPRNIKPKE